MPLPKTPIKPKISVKKEIEKEKEDNLSMDAVTNLSFEDEGYENLNCSKCKLSQWRLLGNFNDLKEEAEYLELIGSAPENNGNNIDIKTQYFNEKHPIKKIILVCINCGFVMRGYMRSKIIEDLFLVKK